MPHLTPERETQIRNLDLSALMGDKSAAVISGHLAALLTEITELRVSVTELRKDSDFLNALEAAGVDNWEGYETACESIGD